MQEFLLPAVFTLGYHTPKPLEVLTAITAAELEDLVLRWKYRAGRAELGHLHLTGTAGEDFFKHVARCRCGGESYLPLQDLRLATEEAMAVVTAQVNAPLRASTLEGRKTDKGARCVQC